MRERDRVRGIQSLWEVEALCTSPLPLRERDRERGKPDTRGS